jgi:hypothetical protein
MLNPEQTYSLRGDAVLRTMAAVGIAASGLAMVAVVGIVAYGLIVSPTGIRRWRESRRVRGLVP